MAADPVVAPPRPRAPQRPRLRPAPPPRRVSGPAGPSAATRSAARTAARSGRAAVRPAAPRARTSGGAVALPAPGLPLQRVLEALRALPDARWLDRLLRGQGWIVLIGIALMGIVAMQVSLLKMNAGIGQSIERAGSLERQNADLRAEVSRLSSEERIASVAAKNGLVMPDAGEVRYVRARGDADARKAAGVMRAPDPADATTTTTTTTAPAAATATTDPAAQAAAPSTATSTSTPPATPPAGATAPTTATPTAQQPAAQPATGTTAGATQAPAGTTAAPGQ